MARRLAAILAADVVGFSRLMGADETGTLERLKSLRKELMQPTITAHGGRTVKLMGDGLLAEFPSVVEAVQCASDIQKAMADREPEISDDRRIRLRIGVNLGDIIVEGSDIYGDGVNVAARLEGLADPGGICISGTAFDTVDGKLDLAFEDVGEQQVKNIAKPVRIYRLTSGSPQSGSPLRPTELPPLPDKPSVAILPFDNMSGDPEQEYFSDGISEDIIAELSRSQNLFVIARNSSFLFKGQAVDVAAVGQKLGVRYVVEGSVRKAGKRIRITAQLIEAATRNHIWADRYDRDLEDLFAVQDEVTERIAWALVGKVGAAEIGRTKRTQRRLDAYDELLRGIDAIHRFSPEDTAVAIEFFKSAVGLEPDSSTAHTWLAEAYASAAGFGGGDLFTALALQSAHRAIELGDAGGHAEMIIAVLSAWKKDFEVAEGHLQRALSLGPTNPYVLVWAGYVCMWNGQIAKAREIGERLKRLDPLEQRWHDQLLAFTYYLLGDYQASLASFYRWDNDSMVRGFANLAACLGQLGRIEEAKATWARCLKSRPAYTIEEYARGSPWRRQEDLEHWLEGLRKAGLEG